MQVSRDQAGAETELERHVEAGQPGVGIRFGLGYVVDAVGAVADDPADLVDPHLAAVVVLARAARREPAAIHGER